MSISFAVSKRAQVTPLWSDATRRVGFALAATLVVALAARVAFKLPFTPVPFTLQPLAVLCVGLFLGPLDGTLAMLAYLAEGAAGLPVFSPTGVGGVAQILGPTGGYLMAYPLVALVSGWLSSRLASKVNAFMAGVLACTAATLLLFLCGAGWLAYLGHLTPAATWTFAIAPFLPGEAVKILVAAGIYQTLRRPRHI